MEEITPDYDQYCQQKEGFADISVLAGCVRITKGISAGAELLVQHELIGVQSTKQLQNTLHRARQPGHRATAGLGSGMAPRQVPTYESKCHRHKIQDWFNIKHWLKVV